MIPTLAKIKPGIALTSVREAPGIMVSTSFATSKGCYFTRFKGSGTWDKSPSSQYVIVYAWNGGSGGGSGGQDTPGGIAERGGSGAAGGNSLMFAAPATWFSASTVVTIGAGGNGGAPVSSSGNGNDGSLGGQTFIGNMTIPFSASSVGKGGSSTTTGGTSGSSSYIMSNGYNITDGTQIGGNAAQGSSTAAGNGYIPDTVGVGSSTVQIPCSPYCIATGGGGGNKIAILTNPGNGGDINFFGSTITYGGSGKLNAGSGSNRSFSEFGQSYAYPYGYGQMLVTGGTGGAGGATTISGGTGGIPGGGGGGGGSQPAGIGASGAGGNGGRGEVWIFEFI